MIKWFEVLLLTLFTGFAMLVFFMTVGCAPVCHSYCNSKLDHVRRDIEEARYKSLTVSDYNGEVIKLFDELDEKVRQMTK